MTIISQQDTEQYHNKQQSSGGRIGVGIGANSPVSVSLNASQLKADSHYQSVQEQSGLFAGTGGFDVQVQNHTDLQAGAIVSEADPENNRFSTDTLSHSTLQNHAKYDVESKSISFSTSGLDSVTKGFGGGASSDSGEAQNTTYAALSDGDIQVRSNPDQNLSKLKKSREEAHRVLERIFSEDKVDQARETAELTQVFAEEAYIAIGNLYKAMEEAEGNLRSAKDAGDASEIDRWEAVLREEKERLPIPKALLHAVAGGVTAVLGGGDFVSGAMAAGVTETVATELAEQLPSNTTLKNVLMASIGGAIGGTSGALIAGTADKFNRQLHPTERMKIREKIGLLREKLKNGQMGLSQFAELSDDELVALFSISAMKSPYGIDEAAYGKEVPTGGFMEGLGPYYTRLYVLLKESVGDFVFTDSQGNRVRAFTNHVFDNDSGEYVERAAWGNNPKQYLYETYGVVGKFETREQIEDYVLHTGTVPLPGNVNKAVMDAETIAYYDQTFKAAVQNALVGTVLTMAGSGKGSLKKVGSKIKAGAAKGYVASSKVFKDWVASVRAEAKVNKASASSSVRGLNGTPSTTKSLASTGLPELPVGYHYRLMGGDVQVVRNPGKAGALPQMHLEGGNLVLGPKPGIVRSSATKSAFLKDLANSDNIPASIKPWLRRGQVPPGYAVHHKKALFDGGVDSVDNMVLQGVDLHKIRHRFYRPGGQVPSINPPTYNP